MKNQKSKIPFIVFVLFLISVLICNEQISDFVIKIRNSRLPSEFTDYQPMSSFYYDRLSDKQKIGYICIFNGLKEHKDKISIPDLSQDDIELIFESIQFDNPDIFFVGDKGYIVTSAVSYIFEPEYLFNEQENEIITEKLNQTVTDIKEKTDLMSNFDKELFIHDYIIENCTYTDTEFDNTVYGCLINKMAVCSGYASSFMYLMNKIGIECNVISGNATDLNGDSSAHLWNFLKLDGEYYFTDVTWDDIESNNIESPIHLYFNMDYKNISINHSFDIDVSYFNCGEKYNYFYYNNTLFDNYNDETTQQITDSAIENILTDSYSVEFIINDKSDYNYAYDCMFTDCYSSDLSEIVYGINKKCNNKVDYNSVSYIKNDKFNYIRIMFNKN